VTVAYLDTSAITKLVAVEPETTALERYAATADGLVTSWLGATETARAARRAGHRRLIQQVEAVLESFVLVDLTRPILARAATLQPVSLRTLDALHLATALELDLPDLEFVTYDGRLADAAARAKLCVRRPA
jgi:predicted nucleic acid-binding protein